MDIREALKLKLGAERITQIVSSQRMAEIERISVQKQCDTLNKIKLLEARQEGGETIRDFKQRLHRLADACNFTMKCSSKRCTEANTESILHLDLCW